MDWNAQIGRELRQLDRIVAILLSLAGLADRAAGAPLPVRWLVLWFLRRAEAVATEFVAGSAWRLAYANCSATPMTVRPGSSPADAIDLALSLSALASAVATLVAQLRRQVFLHCNQPSGRKSLRRRHALPSIFRIAAVQAGCPDTS